MIHWILILSFVPYSSQSGAAIHSIGGFPTLAACMNAGAVWQTNSMQTNPSTRPHFVCAEQRTAK